MKRRLARHMVRLAGAMLLAVTVHAGAQSYPAKPVLLVVPFPPGTVTDLVFRAVAGGMSRSLAMPVLVENRPGANGMISWEFVVRQQPADGYSIAASTNSNLTLPAFYKDLRIDPVKELSPVAIVAESPLVIHSPVAAPWNSMTEMVAYAKANPGKLNWGTSGTASVSSLNMEMIKQKDGLDIVVVPYQANNMAILALVGNDVQLLFDTVTQAASTSQAKKTKVIAVTGEQRLAAFPGVPTLGELGYPGIVGVWWALNVRPGTPRSIVERLNAAARFAVTQADVRDLFSRNSIEPVESSPQSVAKKYEELGRAYVQIAAKAGIRPQ